MSKRSTKQSKDRLHYHAPVGGILTDDAGIIFGQFILTVRYVPEQNHTEVLVRPNGGTSPYMVTGAPLAGEVTVDGILSRIRNMKVERSVTGRFLPFQFSS